MREFKFINFNKGKNYYLIEINRPLINVTKEI